MKFAADRRSLTKRLHFGYSFSVTPQREKHDRAWRKSRIAARLLYRKMHGPLRPREREMALQLSRDPEVSNRLIQQALYFLGGARKHELDRKLVERGD